LRPAFLLVAAALAASPLAAAAAHARLQGADPAPGAVVLVPPAAIRLTFSEPVEAALSGVTLTDPAGHRVPTGKPATDPKDQAVLVVPVTGTLSPGPHKVAWHAVAADSHKTSGSFGFTLKQP
jgi:methionine-rich copper-binding protein CopC